NGYVNPEVLFDAINKLCLPITMEDFRLILQPVS
ncbi:MAG: hypothetical protein RIQ51_245, partial [Bacteroidota bacterium]